MPRCIHTLFLLRRCCRMGSASARESQAAASSSSSSAERVGRDIACEKRGGEVVDGKGDRWDAEGYVHGTFATILFQAITRDWRGRASRSAGWKWSVRVMQSLQREDGGDVEGKEEQCFWVLL